MRPVARRRPHPRVDHRPRWARQPQLEASDRCGLQRARPLVPPPPDLPPLPAPPPPPPIGREPRTDGGNYGHASGPDADRSTRTRW